MVLMTKIIGMASLIPCPACEQEVSPFAATCLKCGHPPSIGRDDFARYSALEKLNKRLPPFFDDVINWLCAGVPPKEITRNFPTITEQVIRDCVVHVHLAHMINEQAASEKIDAAEIARMEKIDAAEITRMESPNGWMPVLKALFSK